MGDHDAGRGGAERPPHDDDMTRDDYGNFSLERLESLPDEIEKSRAASSSGASGRSSRVAAPPTISRPPSSNMLSELAFRESSKLKPSASASVNADNLKLESARASSTMRGLGLLATPEASDSDSDDYDLPPPPEASSFESTSGLIDIRAMEEMIQAYDKRPEKPPVDESALPSFGGVGFLGLREVALELEKPEPTEAEQVVPAERVEETPPSNGPLYFLTGLLTIGVVMLGGYAYQNYTAPPKKPVTVYRSAAPPGATPRPTPATSNTKTANAAPIVARAEVNTPPVVAPMAPDPATAAPDVATAAPGALQPEQPGIADTPKADTPPASPELADPWATPTAGGVAPDGQFPGMSVPTSGAAQPWLSPSAPVDPSPAPAADAQPGVSPGPGTPSPGAPVSPTPGAELPTPAPGPDAQPASDANKQPGQADAKADDDAKADAQKQKQKQKQNAKSKENKNKNKNKNKKRDKNKRDKNKRDKSKSAKNSDDKDAKPPAQDAPEPSPPKDDAPPASDPGSAPKTTPVQVDCMLNPMNCPK